MVLLLSWVQGCSSALTSEDASKGSLSSEPTTDSLPVSSSPSPSSSSNPPDAPISTAASPDASAPSAASSVASGVDPVSGLPWIGQDQLPVEAERALLVIESGGPYPYDQDGVTFENREELLPAHPVGYYREFTVETPGSDDRGARRIVVGDGGEWYYTDDHYDSFTRIAR